MPAAICEPPYEGAKEILLVDEVTEDRPSDGSGNLKINMNMRVCPELAEKPGFGWLFFLG